MVDLSIVLPIYNEERNIEILYKEIKKVLNHLPKTHEIIFVNDGSTDRSSVIISSIKEIDNKVKTITFRKNFGQTAALDAGIKASSGKVIITMDSDLQNDPRDIPRLLKKLEEGYDIVAGQRINRKDTVSKKFISLGARALRRIILKDRLHDSGCTLRAYKKESVNGLNLYGEMHRFIHIILKSKGFKIGEIKVRHRKRIHGKTKYTFSRTLKSLFDMALLKFWMQYSRRPMHIFGSVGFFTSTIGFIFGLYLTYLKLFLGEPIANRPLLLLSILLILLGTFFFMFGILADILIKIYYKDEESYSIKKWEY